MRPVAVPLDIARHNLPGEVLERQAGTLREKLHCAAMPDVSIIIPAYNEEENILKTLSSLAASVTTLLFEVVVVNNNSHDRTAHLAAAAGALCILEPEQGITAARNAGLRVARGQLVLNADADTIYPPRWIDLMTAPLRQEQTGLTYGAYAFLPSTGTSRMVYYFYEGLTGITRWVNRRFREEAVSVYGFNSAFRKEDALEVDGFNHPPGTNEDGWLAVKIRDQRGKKLWRVQDPEALVWTTDRRIQADGGLVKGVFKRMRRHGKAFYS